MDEVNENINPGTDFMYRAFNPNGQWMTEFSIENMTGTEAEEPIGDVDSIGHFEHWKNLFSIDGKQEVKSDSEAYFRYNTRVLQAIKNTSGTDGPPYIPRLISAAIKLKSLKIRLPDKNGNAVFLYIQFNDYPAVSVILDNPFVNIVPDDGTDISFVMAAFSLDVSFTNDMEWPVFIDTDQTFIEELDEANKLKVSPLELLADYLRIPAKTTAKGLRIAHDGLYYLGEMPVPWRDNFHIHGEYALIQSTVSDKFELIIRHNADWKLDLLSYQDAVKDATDEIKNNFNIATQNSPSAGLLASQSEDTVTWVYRNGRLEYEAGKSLFEMEFRGTAGGTARISPDKLEIKNQGREISFASGDQEGATEITYTFDREIAVNKWQGDLPVQIESDGFQAYLDNQQITDSDYITSWVLSPQGPMLIPLIDKENLIDLQQEEENAISLMKGVLRMSSLPWEPSEIPGVANPNYVLERNGSVLLTGIKGVDATFYLSGKETLECYKIEVKVVQPSIRIDKLLPVYRYLKNDNLDIPPSLPEADEGFDTRRVFFTLSFKSQINNNSSESVVWNYQLDFEAGINEEWLDGDLSGAHLSAVFNEKATEYTRYWYHPTNTLLIPSLPLNQAPFSVTGSRLSKNRLYMPIVPQMNTPIQFKMHENTDTLTVKQGIFQCPNYPLDQSLFQWVHLRLPGLSISLIPGEPLTVINGHFSGGKVRVTWRNDLPLLDELYALMVNGNNETNEETIDIAGEKWWKTLNTQRKLSSTIVENLCETVAELNADGLLNLIDFPVEIKNIIGREKYTGQLSLNLIKNSASLSLIGKDQTIIPIITQDNLLKGPTATFKLNKEGMLSPNETTIKELKNQVELVAGSILPFRADNSIDDRFRDQLGHYFSPILNEPIHRRIRIHSKVEEKEIDYHLWSMEKLNLGIENTRIQFHFKGIPLRQNLNSNQWIYANNNPDLDHDMLREYTWGNIGAILLNGYQFQPLQLNTVKFDSLTEGQGCPVKIVITGILHFKPKDIGLADEVRQEVKLEFERIDNSWNVAKLRGNIIWPLYQTQPDFSKAKQENLEGFYPFISSEIGMEKGDIVFGNEANPPQLVFLFMGKIWSIDIRLLVMHENWIEWEVIRSQSTSGISPLNGHVMLEKEPIKDSYITFQLKIIDPTKHQLSLVDFEFKSIFSQSNSNIELVSFQFLGMDVDTILCNDFDEFIFSSSQIRFVLNEKVGFRTQTGTFNLLPGWPVDINAALNGYLEMNLKQENQWKRIKEASISSYHFQIESCILTPDSLGFTLKSHFNRNNSPQWNISFTGQVTFKNTISWGNNGGQDYLHKIDFSFLNGVIENDKLAGSLSSDILFEPIFTEKGQDELIELPVMANHTIYSESNDIFLQWTAAQKVKLFGIKSAAHHLFSIKDFLVDKQHLKSGYHGQLSSILFPVIKEEDTMIIEASEAFWIREADSLNAEKSSVSIWDHFEFSLKGVVSNKTDFTRKTGAWIRLPMPFLTDTKRLILAAISDDEYIANILSNRLESGKIPVVDKRVRIVQRESLDNASLEYEMGFQFRQVPFPLVEVNRQLKETLNAFSIHTAFESAQLQFDHLFPRANAEQVTYELELPYKKDIWFKKNNRIALEFKIENTGLYKLELYAFSRRNKGAVWLSFAENHFLYMPVAKKSESLFEPISAWVYLKGGANTVYIKMLFSDIQIDSIEIQSGLELDYLLEIDANSFVQKSKKRKYGKSRNKHKGKDRHENDLILKRRGWIKYRIEIPEDGVYDLGITLKPTDPNSYFSIYQSIYLVGSILIPKKKDWKTFEQVNRRVFLRKGKRTFKIYCKYGGFYLKSIQIRSHRKVPQMKPIESNPFNLTKLSIEHLLRKSKQPNFLAATEIIPKTKFSDAISERIWNNKDLPKPYFKPSPLIAIFQQEPRIINDDLNFQIHLDIIVSTLDNSWGSDNSTTFSTYASTSFLIGISNEDDWNSILFNTDSENEIRNRVSKWILKQKNNLPGESTALLRARTLYPNELIPAVHYFLLANDFNTSTGGQIPIALSTNQPLQKEITYHKLRREQKDVLMRGPDYLAGKVYYTQQDTYEHAIPTLPINKHDLILSFTVNNQHIKQGQPIKLQWEVKPANEYTLVIEEKDKDQFYYPESSEMTLYPQMTSVFVLRLYSKVGKEIENAHLGVSVEIPVSGSGIGLSYKLAGKAPGINHFSRNSISQDDSKFHRWIEVSKDVLFNDYSRQEDKATNEFGHRLPPSRKLTGETANAALLDNPFLSTRASIIYTAGRPGTVIAIRKAFLNHYSNGDLIRSNPSVLTMRYPRPVPLHQKLLPYPAPTNQERHVFNSFETCIGRALKGAPPFRYYEIKWQDKTYNKKLHALANAVENDWGKLILDRKVYGGVDIIYLELLLDSTITTPWKVNISLIVERKQNGVLNKIVIRNITLSEHEIKLDGNTLDQVSILREVPHLSKKRYVFEIGLDLGLAQDGNIGLEFLHLDQLSIEATKNGRNMLKTKAFIRTDEPVWSQPENAYYVLRRINQKTELAAFGWLERPILVKRNDRFDVGSWAGTFQFRDVFLATQTNPKIAYSVGAVSPYGEQNMDEAKF